MDAIGDLLNYPHQWMILLIVANIMFFIKSVLVDGKSLSAFAGYIAAFGIGFAIIGTLLQSANKVPLFTCEMISDEVANCNGWVSYSPSISRAMVNLSNWYQETVGDSSTFLFALGVVSVVMTKELIKAAPGRGQDVLNAFFLTGFVLFLFTSSGLVVSAVNGAVDSMFPAGISSEAGAAKAAQIINDLKWVNDTAKDLDVLSLVTEKGGDFDWWDKFKVKLTFGALFLASLVNVMMFGLQGVLLYFVPALTLLSVLLGTFSGSRTFGYFVFASLLRLAAGLQLMVFSLIQPAESLGALEAMNYSGEIFTAAVFTAGIGIVLGGKLLLVFLIREAMPMMGGARFANFGRR